VYPDPPNPADYLKREHAAVALARLASQYPSMSFLFLPRPPKDNSQIDPLYISVELLSSPFGVLLYVPLLSFSHSVHRHTGSDNHVGIFASDNRFELSNVGQKGLELNATQAEVPKSWMLPSPQFMGMLSMASATIWDTIVSNGVRILPSRTTNRMAPVFTQAPIQRTIYIHMLTKLRAYTILC